MVRDASYYERDARGKEKRRERLKLAKEKGTHKKGQWEDLKKEFDYRCVKCGKKRHIDKDHIVSLYQGGSDGIDNLQPLCAWCNVGKRSNNFNWVIYRRKNGWENGKD